MAEPTGQKVTYLYELMDAAYDAKRTGTYNDGASHIAIIDTSPVTNLALKQAPQQETNAQRKAIYRDEVTVRYDGRLNVEWANVRMKDYCDGLNVRLRSHARSLAT